MNADSGLPAEVPAARSSEADRHQAVEMLKAAFVEGRLDVEEYADRVILALNSRTHSELDRITSDLPAALPEAGSGRPSRPAPGNSLPFDWPAGVMCLGSIALAAIFYRFPISPFMLVAVGLAIAASVRSRRVGPRWQRAAIWSVSIVVGVALVSSTLRLFF